MDMYESSIFDLSPIPMWLQDHSDVHSQFEIWKKQGITDLHSFLEQDLSRVTLCALKIKLIRVNKKALELFQARDVAEVYANMHKLFQTQMFESHITDLIALWNGETEFSNTTINHTLDGRPIDIKLRAVVLPGHEHDLSRILITTEDISDYQNARRMAESLFKYSPTSLWVQDFSRIKKRIDRLQELGIYDLPRFLEQHPDFVSMCVEDIQYLDVNRATLELFKAKDSKTLFQNMHKVFGATALETMKAQFILLNAGNLNHQRETTVQALDGSTLHLLVQMTVFPGHEHDWSLVQIALTDITSRKNAETSLAYWGKHDVLTGLHNRSFFAEELKRLQSSPIRPISAIFIDVNGLKKSNDHYGHDVGDRLLKRLGGILSHLTKMNHASASRIGGDEFVILMPGADEKTSKATMRQMEALLQLDNQFYHEQTMSLSIGAATTNSNETLEQMLKRADLKMYEKKKRYYHGVDHRNSD